MDARRQGENLRGCGSFRSRNRAAHRLCFFCNESMAFSSCGSAYTEPAAAPPYLHPVHVSPAFPEKYIERSCSRIDRPISSTERAHPVELEISKIRTEFETNAPFTNPPQGPLTVRSCACHDKNGRQLTRRSKSSELPHHVVVAWAYSCTPHFKQNSVGLIVGLIGSQRRNAAVLFQRHLVLLRKRTRLRLMFHQWTNHTRAT